jgi:hypothetical protein
MGNILNSILDLPQSNPKTRLRKHTCNCGCSKCRTKNAIGFNQNEALEWQDRERTDEVRSRRSVVNRRPVARKPSARRLVKPGFSTIRFAKPGTLVFRKSTASQTSTLNTEKTVYLPIELGSAGQNSVGVYFPSGFKSSNKVDVIIFLHGYKQPCGMDKNASIKTYWQDSRFALREKIESARKNVILVAPTLGPKSEPGWMTQKGGLDRFLSKVLDGLKQQNLLPAGAMLGNLILAGHSGAGKYLRQIIGLTDKAVQNLREVWLFDALYYGKNKGNKPNYLINNWASWAKQHPNVSIFAYYQKNGEPAIASLGLASKGLKNYVALDALKSHCLIPGASIEERVKVSSNLQSIGNNQSKGEDKEFLIGQLGQFWANPINLFGKIIDAAIQSPLATYGWKGNRGRAPIGYIKGMALVYARVYKKFLDGDVAALEMAKANTGNAAKDALAYYAPEFNRLGMKNDTPGVDTLRHLFVLLIGLGMRESSGKWCTGRDRFAKNISSDTAEAGLFQTSYNAKSASPILPQLFQIYSKNPQGFLEVFKEGVKCKSYDLENFGSGNGKKFQELSKHCPAFATEFTAVALRNRRKHWGPINRKNVELRVECDKLLLQIQQIVDYYRIAI